MGVSPSTRKVTVVNDRNDIIKLSGPVLQRINEGIKKSELNKDQSKNLSHSNILFQSALESNGTDVTTNELQKEELKITNIYPPIDVLTEKQEQEFKLIEIENQFKRQLEILDEQNKELWILTNKKLSDNIKKVEEKYIFKAQHLPICSDLERNLETCYKENSAMPLKCSKHVKDFVNCVDQIKKEVFSKAS